MTDPLPTRKRATTSDHEHAPPPETPAPDEPAGGPDTERELALRRALVVLLALNSGAIDAVGFLALGGSFTSVMTGNMVLLGLSSAHRDGTLAVYSATAIVFFIVGCGVGAKIAGSPQPDQPVWPKAVSRALAGQLGLAVVFAVGWWVADAQPSGDARLWLLIVNAIALGMQSSTVLRFGVPGLSTTYMTGTLTTLVSRLTGGGRFADVAHSLQILLSLIAGAVFGAILTVHAKWFAPALPLGCVLTVVVIGTVVLASPRRTKSS